jgi:membrane-associated phospholipid phosphatase
VTNRPSLHPVEWLLLMYLAGSTLLGVGRLPGYPAVGWVLLANALMAGVVVVLATVPLSPSGRVLRELTPLFLLGALYPAIDLLNHFGAIPVHDSQVRHWEVVLFGSEISRTWWQRAGSPGWSLVFHSAYLSYYPIVALPPMYFLGVGDRAAARRAVLWLISAFLLCYAVFLAFPVAGPYYEFPRPADWFLANPAARLVYGALSGGSAYGAAFPSSHVAATLVAVVAAARAAPRLAALLLGPALLLLIGVVYCQMHYGVDALGGIAIAGLVVGGWRWWERRCGESG